MLRTMHSHISSLSGSGSRRSLRDAISTYSGLLPMTALLAVLGVVFCSAAGAQTAHLSWAQTTLATGFTAPCGVAVDSSGNVYVADADSNSVEEIEAVDGVIPATPTIRTLGSGFTSPAGVAVDASGNVYVADFGNSEVKEMLAVDGVIPAVPTINILGSGFLDPTGVAVDASGDVFVADTGNSEVKEMLAVNGSIPATPAINTLGSGFNNPFDVAVDASGNVFVTDSGNSEVKEMLAVDGVIPAVPTINILGSGFLDPTGVAVDASGNVFVADTGNSEVKEMLAVNGSIPATPAINTLGSGFNNPFGVAVDASGNVFVGDTNNGQVVKLFLSSGDLGRVYVGASATATLGFTFDTGGSIALPAVLTQGQAALDFTDDSADATTTGSCVNNGVAYVYTPGNTCTVEVLFTPAYPGERDGAVVLSTNAGAPIVTVGLEGVGVAPQVSFLPATQSTLGSGFDTPGGLAVDVKGDVFVADTNHAAVKEIPFGGGVTPLGIGFSAPNGVAIDGAGNLFVSDNYNGIEEILAAGGYTNVISLGSGFTQPQGVAVDGYGNVYVADTGNDAVKELTADSGYATVTSLGSGFSAPSGVAVDSSGDVFVADTGNNAVKEIVAVAGSIPASPTIHTLGSGFSAPRGVAVDGVGNVYVADTGNGAVKEITVASAYSTVNTLITGLSAPTGVAVSELGNLYIVGSYTTVLEEDYADPPSLSFGNTDVGVATADQTVTVQNIGNATLTIEAPAGNDPAITTGFDLDNSAATACTVVTSPTTASLAAGVSCTLSAYFDSATYGPFTGTLTLTDNTLNAVGPTYAAQVIPLSGTGYDSQTITFTPPVSPVAYGTGPYTLAATAVPSGLPVSFSILSGPGTLSGLNNSTLTITGVGTIVIAANQAGNAQYAPAPQVTQSVVVVQATQTINFTPPASPVTYGTGPYTLAATGGLSGNPVVFSILSGPGSLSGTNNNTLTITGVGTIVIAANQAGNTDYLAAPQVTQSVVVNGIAQTISFTAPTSPVTYGVAPITLAATGGASGNPVVFSILSGPGTLSGTNNNTLTVTGVGTIVIAANQAGNSTYAAASQVTQSVVVNAESQAIVFTPPTSPVTYGVAPITLTATGGGSTNPVVFSILSGPGTLSGTNDHTLTVTGVGTIMIAANQAGSADYAAAPQVTQSVLVNAESQAIVFTPPTSPVTYGVAPITLAATGGGSTNPVVFSILSGPGTLSGTNDHTLTVNGVGTIVIAANQAGNADYAAAPQVTQSVVVNGETQTINFTAPTSPVTYGVAPITLAATGGASGNPVVFTIVSGPGSITGTTLTVNGAGVIVIAANQAGNADYAAAAQVTQSVVVNGETQTINFTAPASPVTYGVAPITLTATGGASGNPVVFTIVSGPGSITGTTLTVNGAGVIVIAANQAGNADYATAPEVTQSVVVVGIMQTIDFTAPASPVVIGAAPVTLAATGGASGNPVVFSILSGPGTLSGTNNDTLTFAGVGKIVIAANQAGNSTYAPAPQVTQSVIVTAVLTVAPPTFTLPGGTYEAGQVLTILDTTPGAAIYYTTDGTTPTAGSTLYAGPITLNVTQTIEAIAIATGYNNSPVVGATYDISAAVTPDFTMAATPTSITTTAGQSAATMLTVTPLNGFDQAVTLTCTSGLPSGATCTIDPATVTPVDGPISALVTITTATATSSKGSGPRPFIPATALALALCCFGFRKRRRILWMMVLLVASVAGLGVVTGCASSTGYTTAPTVTSLITITGTPTTGPAHTTSFLLGVRP